MEIKEAVKTLSKAIKDDHDYAWAWHCNIAMASQDEGLEHKVANKAAARFMFSCFGVDTSRLQQYKDLFPDKLTASEAVYGFAGWLTTRKEKTVMSSSDECGTIAELVSEFCKENNLEEPRERYFDYLTHPEN